MKVELEKVELEIIAQLLPKIQVPAEAAPQLLAIAQKCKLAASGVQAEVKKPDEKVQ